MSSIVQLVLFILFILSLIGLIGGILILVLRKKKPLGITLLSVSGVVFLFLSCYFIGHLFFSIYQGYEKTATEENAAEALDPDYGNGSDDYSDDYFDDYTEGAFGSTMTTSNQIVVTVSKPSTGNLDERGLDKYYKIDVAITNNSDENLYVSADDFYLYDYTTDMYPDVIDKDYFHEKIEPGKSANFSVYFDYVDDDAELEVEYADLIWS
ncbi:DUF4352 domain-containing protein [Listeria costaricensis]|uniref:DUF4352 domain-containing protein n=1 Tax=Listeria costaricensis TaxID=2026604 RepID=UPI000C08018E|nr:DUF4352 domain-containing protein [Listeria costaricensis]